MIDFAYPGVPRWHQHRSRPGRERGLHIAPNVADHEALAGGAQLAGSRRHQARRRFAAAAASVRGVGRCHVSKGPSNDSTRALTWASSSGLINPRATPDWLLITPLRRRDDAADSAFAERPAWAGPVAGPLDTARLQSGFRPIEARLEVCRTELGGSHPANRANSSRVDAQLRGAVSTSPPQC